MIRYRPSSVVKTEPATAKVYLDTDTYGDKELKIAPRKYTRVGVVTVATYLYVRIVMYRLYNHTIILLRSRCNVNNDII